MSERGVGSVVGRGGSGGQANDIGKAEQIRSCRSRKELVVDRLSVKTIIGLIGTLSAISVSADITS